MKAIKNFGFVGYMKACKTDLYNEYQYNCPAKVYFAMLPREVFQKTI
jgi:hypothetical protein